MFEKQALTGSLLAAAIMMFAGFGIVGTPSAANAACVLSPEQVKATWNNQIKAELYENDGTLKLTNNTSCSFSVTAAAYSIHTGPKPGFPYGEQSFYSQSPTKVVAPGATVIVGVTPPSCNFQGDFFYGDFQSAVQNWSRNILAGFVKWDRGMCPLPSTPTPTPTPTVKPSPTPTPTVKPSPTPVHQFLCIPRNYTIEVGKPITVKEDPTGGQFTANWGAPGATKKTGTGTVFTTSYTTPGVKKITAHSINFPGGNIQSTCTINVVEKGTPTPTPTATPTTTPEPDEDNPGIRVEKTDHRDVTRPGHTLTYTIKVENTGEEDLHDVEIKDTVPGQLIITGVSNGGDIDGQRVTWKGVELGEGDSKEFTISVKVRTNTPNNHILHNVVTAKSEDHDVSDEASDDTIVVKEPIVKGSTTIIEKHVPVSVPVTAKTGAAGIATLLSVVTGGSGLAFTLRKFF